MIHYAYRVLKGGGCSSVSRIGNPNDSGQEDWGNLGKIGGITTPS